MITHFGNYDIIELPTPQTYSPATGITQQRRFRMLKTSVPAFTATLAAQGNAIRNALVSVGLIAGA